MGIEAPHEVHTGELKPVPPLRQERFSIAMRVRELISARQNAIAICDHELPIPSAGQARRIAAKYRRAVRRRFEERRPNADKHTWVCFCQQINGTLKAQSEADDDTLRVILNTIDGL